MYNNINDQKEKLREEIEQLNEQIKIEEHKRQETKQELGTYQQQFNAGERQLNTFSKLARRVVRLFRSTAAYVLGRRNIKHLYSRSFKTKHASNQLKTTKYFLYNLGFVERSLTELKDKLNQTFDKYLRRAINWELGLWYANQLSEAGAMQSLMYLQAASRGEKEPGRLRRIMILQAENLDQLNHQQVGKRLIRETLEQNEHPDLYLAMANLEAAIEERLHWINQVMSYYKLQPITFRRLDETTTYDDLQTTPIHHQVQTGPKVSVLLPAYNAENGIQIAIESILHQTWQNIELIIVDDCSTDGTVDVIQQYLVDERISFYSTPENSGPYVARNIGLQHATGEFVTINDADDWSHAEKIAIQVNHLIENPEMIANTSEHARLTEDLKLHRRGTPGSYIFSNMSSLLFRREPVLQQLGYWDSVRFAADGEFKRRLIKQFGSSRIVDLPTGPLSLPRQSTSSLTGSSAFGYSGYFMGARKEYVASFMNYHENADTLYYPYPLEQRLFPVPEPMWPKREAKPLGKRHFDVVIAGDFQMESDLQLSTIKEINVHKKVGISTGIIQMSCYNKNRPKELSKQMRQLMNGRDVQALVYGEEISCEVLIIKGHSILQERQRYLPNVHPKMVAVIIDDAQTYNFRPCTRHLVEYVGKRGIWYAYNQDVYQKLQTKFSRELRFIRPAIEPWIDQEHEAIYQSRLDDWLTDENPYIK